MLGPASGSSGPLGVPKLKVRRGSSTPCTVDTNGVAGTGCNNNSSISSISSSSSSRCDLCKFVHPVAVTLRDINKWTCVQVYNWLEQLCAGRFLVPAESIIGKLM
jgi:hypothetical protein